jgi:hypothetical protein
MGPTAEFDDEAKKLVGNLRPGGGGANGGYQTGNVVAIQRVAVGPGIKEKVW